MKWFPSRLALRIYAIGIVQFLVVAAVMEIDHRSHEAERRAHFAQEGPTWRPPPPLEGDFQPPPPGGNDRPPPPGALPRDRRGPPPGQGPKPPFRIAIVTILIVVGVSSWLLARSFARPLESLAKTTRAFGDGRFDTRAAMKRKDEIGEVARAFDDMADRITALLRAERELLANVSHELRTPLARIRIALDIASEAGTNAPSATNETLAEIAQDLAELERIVDDVLASARLALEEGNAGDATKLPIRREPVDVRALLERSIAKFVSAHPARKLVTEITVDPELVIVGDPVLLRRVVDNLLDNAHKYTDRADAPITIAAESTEAEVTIAIRDRGIGISEADQARLFEPFFRVDRSRTRSTGGLGLGLLLAKRVVEAHGGTLALTSAVGEGTTAHVRIPG